MSKLTYDGWYPGVEGDDKRYALMIDEDTLVVIHKEMLDNDGYSRLSKWTKKKFNNIKSKFKKDKAE